MPQPRAARKQYGPGSCRKAENDPAAGDGKHPRRACEFLMMLIFVVGVIVAAYASSADALSREDGWRFASFVAAAYIVSRGLAKLGTREPYTDD